VARRRRSRWARAPNPRPSVCIPAQCEPLDMSADPRGSRRRMLSCRGVRSSLAGRLALRRRGSREPRVAAGPPYINRSRPHASKGGRHARRRDQRPARAAWPDRHAKRRGRGGPTHSALGGGPGRECRRRRRRRGPVPPRLAAQAARTVSRSRRAGRYTTFSTIAVEVDRLLSAHCPVTAALYALTTVLGCAAAVWVVTAVTQRGGEAVIADRLGRRLRRSES
jgi:hypothetical protein